MSYLCYLCLLAHSRVQHTMDCVFLCFYSSCVPYMCMLPVSLDCPFLIATSVFSNVYLDCSRLYMTLSTFKLM